MQLNTADAAFLVGDAAALAAMPGTPPLEPFSPRVLDLFDALSKALLSRPDVRRFPDLAALAFWCRRAAMEERRKPYLDGEFRLGRGMAFHIAPGNVPLNFAYSLAAGLLAGNANAVRLPSEPFPQAALVCAALEELLARRVFRPAALRRLPCAIRAKAASPRRFPPSATRGSSGAGTRRSGGCAPSR